jgi:hypothetical protein
MLCESNPKIIDEVESRGEAEWVKEVAMPIAAESLGTQVKSDRTSYKETKPITDIL